MVCTVLPIRGKRVCRFPGSLHELICLGKYACPTQTHFKPFEWP